MFDHLSEMTIQQNGRMAKQERDLLRRDWRECEYKEWKWVQKSSLPTELGNDSALPDKKKSRPKTTERGPRKREKAVFKKMAEI